MLRSQADLAAENEAMLWVLGVTLLIWALSYPAWWLHERRMKQLRLCSCGLMKESPWVRYCRECADAVRAGRKMFNREDGH